MERLATAIDAQFERAWDMLRATVKRIPDEAWKSENDDRMAPARWALHAVQSVAFYSHVSPEAVDRSNRIDWEGELSLLPDRDALLRYVVEVAATWHSMLEGWTDTIMMEGTSFNWTGETKLEQAIYALRHMTYHMGELSRALRAMGADEGEWK